MDNTTAIDHINNNGGTSSACLITLALELWRWCLYRNIMLSAQHVYGKLNSIADSESSMFNDNTEWKINPQIISPFLKECKIDLLASCLAAQLPKYASCRLDSEALDADAMKMNWGPFKGYAIPSFNLIVAVLNKVTQDKADVILVAPLWQAQPCGRSSWAFWSSNQSSSQAPDNFWRIHQTLEGLTQLTQNVRISLGTLDLLVWLKKGWSLFGIFSWHPTLTNRVLQWRGG